MSRVRASSNFLVQVSSNETTAFLLTGQPNQNILGEIKDTRDICQDCVIRRWEHLSCILTVLNFVIYSIGGGDVNYNIYADRFSDMATNFISRK